MPREVDWGPGALPAGAAREHLAAEFALELEACHGLEAEAAARMASWPEPASPATRADALAYELISLELARSTKTYRAAVLLASEGFGEQAAMLNRSLFEGMAVAHWVYDHPSEAVTQFESAARLAGHLAAELIHDVDWTDQVDPDVLREARLDEEELAALRRKFGRYGGGLWTGHQTLHHLVRDIQGQWSEEGRATLWQFLKIAHRDNNQLLHSTVSSLHRAISQRAPDGSAVWIGPSTVSVGEALLGSYWIYAQTLTLAADHFGFDDRARLSSRIAEDQYAFVKVEAESLRTVGRNDPCPCGRPDSKFKNCHLPQVEARLRKLTR